MIQILAVFFGVLIVIFVFLQSLHIFPSIFYKNLESEKIFEEKKIEVNRMIDRHLESMLFRQKGNNRKLTEEVLDKLSPESKERLFRILQDHEHDKMHLERKARMPWMNMR